MTQAEIDEIRKRWLGRSDRVEDLGYDWTCVDRVSNRSSRFLDLCDHVARLLPSVLADRQWLAGFIVAQLAHKHDMIPGEEARADIRKLLDALSERSMGGSARLPEHP